MAQRGNLCSSQALLLEKVQPTDNYLWMTITVVKTMYAAGPCILAELLNVLLGHQKSDKGARLLMTF